jgi:hypothetical protein
MRVYNKLRKKLFPGTLTAYRITIKVKSVKEKNYISYAEITNFQRIGLSNLHICYVV